jgi:hypothetical protein
MTNRLTVPICGMLAAELWIGYYLVCSSWATSERKGGMAGKADFTEDDWRIVLEGPPTAESPPLLRRAAGRGRPRALKGAEPRLSAESEF